MQRQTVAIEKNRAQEKWGSRSNILKCKSNIGYQYKTNVNININNLEETDVNLSYVNISFLKNRC